MNTEDIDGVSQLKAGESPIVCIQISRKITPLKKDLYRAEFQIYGRKKIKSRWYSGKRSEACRKAQNWLYANTGIWLDAVHVYRRPERKMPYVLVRTETA